MIGDVAGNWFGALAVVAGIWLLVNAIGRRRRVRTEAAAAIARGEPVAAGSARLSGLAEIMPPLVNGALFIAALQLVAAWWFTDAGIWFSAFDLAALLFLLLSYGIWLTLRSRYRPGWRPG